MNVIPRNLPGKCFFAPVKSQVYQDMWCVRISLSHLEIENHFFRLKKKKEAKHIASPHQYRIVKAQHGRDLQNVQKCAVQTECVGCSLSGIKLLIRMYKLSDEARNHVVFPTGEGLSIFAENRVIQSVICEAETWSILLYILWIFFSPKHLTMSKYSAIRPQLYLRRSTHKWHLLRPTQWKT